MFEFGLKDFRGFQDTGFVPIRPLTFLIGENSSGKTSFLAGLKYILDFSSGREASFNKDPFQLGTFQQITHFRGGKAGRAKRFSLKSRKEIFLEKRKNRKSSILSFEIVFDSFDSQAAISSIELSSEGDTLRIVFGAGRVSIEFFSKGKEVSKVAVTGALSRVSRADFGKYWHFLIEDIGLRIFGGRHVSEDQLPEDAKARVEEIQQLMLGLAREMSGYAEATSAIRTKPLRTYTPGIETKDGEGSHVPFEMAKLYRSNKEAWLKLKSSLDQYGNSSDMFKEISIKSFGQTASDPFQLQFSSDGPKMNMVDLGYGTSQVLPILYNIATTNGKGRFLIQQPEVHLHPRAQAALGSYFIEAFLSNGQNFVLETHSDFIIDRARQAIASKTLKPEHVSILFFERKRLEDGITLIELSDQGDPITPPLTYRTFFLNEELKLLGSV